MLFLYKKLNYSIFLLSLLFEEFSSSFRSTEPVFVEPITPAVDELEPFELLFRYCKLLISFLILELPLPLPLLPGGDSSSLFIVIFGSGTKLKDRLEHFILFGFVLAFVQRLIKK